MADETIWGIELVPEGWFAKETQADGWFDRDLLDVAASAGATASPAAGAVTTTGFAPTASAGSSVPATATPTAGAVTVSGFAPAASAASGAAASLGVVTVTGFSSFASAAASVVTGLGAVSVVGFDIGVEAGSPPRRDGGAEIQHRTRIKEWFLERQLKEFEETLAEIGEAEDAPEAVEAALEAFEPIAARVDDRQSLAAVRAISEALRTVADSRQARNAAVAEVETQLAKIAAIQRRKRRDEAAILLLM